jgi:hypothetical protein
MLQALSDSCIFILAMLSAATKLTMDGTSFDLTEHEGSNLSPFLLKLFNEVCNFYMSETHHFCITIMICIERNAS